MSCRIYLQIVFCDRRCDRQEDFACRLECVDVFVLKHHLDTEVAEFSDSFQQLCCIPCEAGYGFRIDFVELMLPCILHHHKELWTLLYAVAADALVCINTDELCIRVIFECALPVVFLEFVAMQLCIPLCRYTDISDRPCFFHVVLSPFYVLDSNQRIFLPPPLEAGVKIPEDS